MSEARQRGNQPPTPAGDAPRADDVLRPANRASNSFVERVSTKVHAVFWVAAAALLLTRGQVLDAAADPSRSSPFFRPIASRGAVASILTPVRTPSPRLPGPSNWPAMGIWS